jgi:hypothetical protein
MNTKKKYNIIIYVSIILTLYFIIYDIFKYKNTYIEGGWWSRAKAKIKAAAKKVKDAAAKKVKAAAKKIKDAAAKAAKIAAAAAKAAGDKAKKLALKIAAIKKAAALVKALAIAAAALALKIKNAAIKAAKDLAEKIKAAILLEKLRAKKALIAAENAVTEATRNQYKQQVVNIQKKIDGYNKQNGSESGVIHRGCIQKDLFNSNVNNMLSNPLLLQKNDINECLSQKKLRQINGDFIGIQGNKCYTFNNNMTDDVYYNLLKNEDKCTTPCIDDINNTGGCGGDGDFITLYQVVQQENISCTSDLCKNKSKLI